MKIAVIGCGNMGGGLARSLAGNHDILIGSRDPERARAKAGELAAAGSGSYREVAEQAELLLFTIPWWGVDDALSELGDVDGKILVDTTNPYTDASYSELHEFPGSSGSEKIQERAPGARVVKAWNHVYAPIVNSSAEFGSESATVFVCGDDEDAKHVVAGLAREIGYDPVDAGPLSMARNLERVAALMVGLAYGVGMGTNQALKLMRR